MYLIKHVIDNSSCFSQQNFLETLCINPPILNIYDKNGFFYRVFSKENGCVTNSFQLGMQIENAVYYFPQQIVVFSVALNAAFILQLHALEHSILEKANITEKRYCYSIYSHLLTGILKTNMHDRLRKEKSHNLNIILQISGIWESQYAAGLVYKFICVSSPL
jgi:hypothetical protein